MSKNYNAIDGIIKQTRECVTDAYNKGYKDGYKDGQVVTQQAFDATYEQGFNDGHKALVKDMEGKTTYQRGLEDAWKVAREVIKMDSTQQFEIFGEHGDINILDNKSAKEAIKLYEGHKEKQKTLEQDRACPILDDNCPYPWLLCEECEVYCVMERANKAIEENINKRLNNKED